MTLTDYMYREKSAELELPALRRLITTTRKNTYDTRSNKTYISPEKTRSWHGKGNLLRETESILIAAQNNAIRTNHIKARIDETYQNSKWRLYGNRYETIHHIISEFSKSEQKNIRLDMIGWTKWSTGNCAKNWNLVERTNGICVTEHQSKKSDTHTPLEFWDTNGSLNLGQTTRPYNYQQKKRTCRTVDFTVSADHSKTLRNKKKYKNLDVIRGLKNLWNMKSTIIPIVIGALGTVTKGLAKGLEDLEIRG